MKKFLRMLCGVFFMAAVGALSWLLLPDLWENFQPSPRHAQAGALALMLVGLSFICLQLGSVERRRETLKRLLLGLAFVLWGGEQFLPPGPAATAVDSAVIAIFVIDLGLVIAGRLEKPQAA
jgi:hypothetical protein